MIELFEWSVKNSGIIQALASVLLFVITAVSVTCAFKAYGHQKKRAKKEVSCDLAKHYAECIIDKYSVISDILITSGLLVHVEELFRYSDLKSFDLHEFNRLVSGKGKESKDVHALFMGVKADDILLVRITSEVFARKALDVSSLYLSDDEAKKEAAEHVIIKGFYDDIVHLLNELEWFSMNLRYKIADEALLYQSLHQSFLSCVWQLYYYIATRNIDNENKYYTNILWLYGLWNGRFTKIQEKAAKKKERAVKRVRTFSEKSENIKAKVHSGQPLH